MSKANASPVSPLLVRAARVSALLLGVGSAVVACASGDTDLLQMSTSSSEVRINGQSGTEQPSANGEDVPSCPCAFLTNPLRGTVLEVETGSVRVRVDELLAGTAGLEIGSEIVGTWFGQLPCFEGCASVAVGDDVLAFYKFPRPCINSTGDDCPLGATTPARIDLAPWGDTVLLARTSTDLTLAVKDLPLLESLPLEECQAHFGNIDTLRDTLPNETQQTCDDRSVRP